MPTAEAFSIEDTESKLNELFLPEFLTHPHNRGYYPATLLHPYELAILDALSEYAKDTHGIKDYHRIHFGFHERHDLDIKGVYYVTEKFFVNCSTLLNKSLEYRENTLICRYVDEAVREHIEQSQPLTDIITSSSVRPREPEKWSDMTNATKIRIEATIEPVPDNFRKYLQVADLYAYAHKWLESAADEAVKRMENEYRDIVVSSRPEF